MPLWLRHPRAAVLAHELKHNSNVLSANLFNAAASPYPFGLGVYTRRTGNGAKKRDQLPLLYVSYEVAKDRAPENNERNPPGVREGWYVIAEEGVEFEVVMTCLNASIFTGSTDVIHGELFVDGRNTHNCFDTGRDGVRWEQVAKGFLTEQKKISKSKVHNKLQLFTFTEALVCEEDDEEDEDSLNTESGQISLVVSTGTTVKGDSESDEDWFDDEASSGYVNEKMVHKRGLSLQAGGSNYATEIEQTGRSNKAVHLERCKEADITLHVRKAVWMRSRRLIDDEGRPCTFEKYLELLESDNVIATATPVKQENSLPKKQFKRPKILVSSDEEDVPSTRDKKKVKSEPGTSGTSGVGCNSSKSSPDHDLVKDFIDLTDCL